MKIITSSVSFFALFCILVSGVAQAAVAVEPPKGPASHIIVYKKGVDPEMTTSDLAKRHGLGITHRYRHALLGAAARIPPGRLHAVTQDPRVAYVEENHKVEAHLQTLPTGVNRIDADLNIFANIDGLDDSMNVDIAILDSGIDLDHPELNVQHSIDCARWFWCLEGKGNDNYGHGTHVAGIAAARDNGDGVVGVAPGARLWAVKVLGDTGSGYESWIVAGVDYVTAHADEIEVANMSLGCHCQMTALRDAIQNSINHGVVYTVSAGNDAADAFDYSPAGFPSVITVSAMADFNGEGGGGALPTCRYDVDDSFADFSNYGSVVDIAAPGVCNTSTWAGGGYNTISGTSMASPHVAGAAALYILENGRAYDAAGVNDIKNNLIARGTAQDAADGFWGDPDAFHEPLLNVASAAQNAAPLVTITAPNAGSSFHVLQDVDCAGSADDPEDGDLSAGLVWSSSRDGQLGSGAALSVQLSEGQHTLTATAVDAEGKSGSDAVTVTVINDAPVVAITSPLDGETFADATTPISFSGTASDTEDLDLSGDDLVWSSNLDGVIGSGASILATLSQGTHTIQARATDSGGKVGSASIIVTVGAVSDQPSEAGVVSIDYSVGGNKVKTLTIQIIAADNLGAPLEGVQVDAELVNESTSQVWPISAVTKGGGLLRYRVKNAPAGTYHTTVLGVDAAGLSWDGLTPDNEITF